LTELDHEERVQRLVEDRVTVRISQPKVTAIHHRKGVWVLDDKVVREPVEVGVAVDAGETTPKHHAQTSTTT
jgi:hypothetical protein